MKQEDLELSTVWKTALGELEVVVSEGIYKTWLKDTILDSLEDGVFTVGVPNFFYRDWMTKNVLSTISKALKNATGIEPKLVKVKVVSAEKFKGKNLGKKEVIHRPVDNSQENEAKKKAVDNSAEIFSESPRYSFESFIVGPNNRLAHAAAMAVAEKPGSIYNPLFIYSPSGLGKTHLIKAIQQKVKELFPKKETIYISSEEFTNDFINGIRNDTGASFRKRYRGVDLLIIDDIQFIGGKEGTQEEFFHTFNYLHQNNKQVVLASDRVPRAIKGLEERLVTRFEWGMLADIGKPDLETRQAILQEKCREKEIELPEEVIEFIASKITSSIRELEGALNKIVAEMTLYKKPASLSLAESVLQHVAHTEKLNRTHSPSKIFKTICSFYQIKQDDLLGKKRSHDIVRPRQLCMYLMRTEANLSFPEIAREMGGKDHSTIIYGCKSIEKILATDHEIKTELNMLKEKIRGN